jgi:hypothetical protein
MLTANIALYYRKHLTVAPEPFDLDGWPLGHDDLAPLDVMFSGPL